MLGARGGEYLLYTYQKLRQKKIESTCVGDGESGIPYLLLYFTEGRIKVHGRTSEKWLRDEM